MSTPNVTNISSDDEDDEIEVLEFRKLTQDLLDHPSQSEERRITKKLSDVQCPICFDVVNMATTTSCGHIFCLECIEHSISSSHARGQVRSSQRGRGLCPLCRKQVVFKETIPLKMKKANNIGKPNLPPK